MIALSPDRPEKLEQSLEVKGLGYALYSDSTLDVARRFGIVYQLDDAQVAEYAKYGIDLEDASGKPHHQLPVPSVFLIDPDGITIITFVRRHNLLEPILAVITGKQLLPVAWFYVLFLRKYPYLQEVYGLNI